MWIIMLDCDGLYRKAYHVIVKYDLLFIYLYFKWLEILILYMLRPQQLELTPSLLP